MGHVPRSSNILRGFTKVQIQHLLWFGESLLCTNQDEKNRQQHRRELHDERLKDFRCLRVEMKICLCRASYIRVDLQITINVNKLVN